MAQDIQPRRGGLVEAHNDRVALDTLSAAMKEIERVGDETQFADDVPERERRMLKNGAVACWSTLNGMQGNILKRYPTGIPERLAALSKVGEDAFQARVQPWVMECFGTEIAADLVERTDRATEEMLELSQAICAKIGVDFAPRAHALVDYVAGRPIGEPAQEVGGVMVTLAALCLAAGLDMHGAGETELARITRPEIVQKIRAKQAAKPTGSALPIAALATPDPSDRGEGIEKLEAALKDACDAMEYWAGCDEGCTTDTASSEIMSSGGAWPAQSYDAARALLNKDTTNR